jgi:hypothetical protein
MPKEGEPGFSQMMIELERVFAEHQIEGKVAIRYVTDCYHGSLE